ncbi:respiratory nitrate reductase subunit gamma [Dehalobacter sp. DCM]|uniref:respiratory nitrate reductase subunit gamma n=1 Tax=Dehalobacter sp. DCM TaxID=2907827 RepID=UPI0030817981|nr:respiratory nitrate reductase subunit gamma [Dehalobacter sp. DCM]
MLLTIYLFISVLFFIVFSAYKAWKYASMPIHSRLELYPVPKEAGRASYGGSYYEEVEWWNKPRQVSHGNEIKDMLQEMLFIKKLFENHQRLWWPSYSFHIGIYFLFLWTICLLIGTAWPEQAITYLINITGVAGFVLASIGNIALLIRRITDHDMRKYTTPQEYFNLFLILAVLLSGIYAWSGNVLFFLPREIIHQLLTFQALQVDPAVLIHLILLSFMFIYIPLSKMNHYVGKFFTFHKVLWENEPNLPGSKVEKELMEAAAHPPATKWSAPHMNQD